MIMLVDHGNAAAHNIIIFGVLLWPSRTAQMRDHKNSPTLLSLGLHMSCLKAGVVSQPHSAKDAVRLKAPELTCGRSIRMIGENAPNIQIHQTSHKDPLLWQAGLAHIIISTCPVEGQLD